MDLIFEFRWVGGTHQAAAGLDGVLIASKSICHRHHESGPAVLAAKRRTRTVPIVMAVSSIRSVTGA